MTKWISVEDRLPERGTEALVYYQGRMGKYIACGTYENKCNPGWSEFQSGRSIYVTHWMLLPDPPKED